MSKSGVRIKKSRSMMVSLYSLSGVGALLILSFVITLWLRTMAFLGGINWTGIGTLIQNSLWLQTTAIVIAFPMAVALTYLITFWSNSRWSSGFQLTKDLIEGAPLLMFGVIFLALLGPQIWAVVMTFALIATTELTRRWLHVTGQVSVLEIETMMSLGVGLVPMIYILYIKRLLILFLGHLLAVFCQLFVLVAPVVCFLNVLPNQETFISLHLFRLILAEVDSAAGLAFLLMVVHLVRVLIDQRTSFWEAQYG